MLLSFRRTSYKLRNLKEKLLNIEINFNERNRSHINLILIVTLILFILYYIYDFFLNPEKTFRIFPKVYNNIVKNEIEWLKNDSRLKEKFNNLQNDIQSQHDLLDMEILLDNVDFPLSSEFINDNEFTPYSLKTFTDPFPLIHDKPKDYDFTETYMCSELEYEDSFEVTRQSYLDYNLVEFLDSLRKIKAYWKLVQSAKVKFNPQIPEEKQWFRFGGSSVWIPEFKIHYMVSRVLFSPSGIANKAYVSFLYIQIYDENWRELPKNTKLTIPFEEFPKVNHMNLDGTFTIYQSKGKLNFKTLEFPQILPIPIDYSMSTPNEKYYYGPEDPRILLRTNPLGFNEPLIVFNMKDLNLVKRTMFLYLPFSNDLKVLKKRKDPYAKIEKNWTPFISPSQNSLNKINFIYSIVPLEVLVCDINTAICDFLQKPKHKKKDYVGALRGGSQLIPLPLNKLLPSRVLEDHFKFSKHRQIFLGWARAHLNKCGCGESMYRPNMIILIEDFNPETEKFYYKLGDVSEYVDFGAYVPPWVTSNFDSNSGTVIEEVLDPKQCEGRNVLIPNSIAYWEILSMKQSNKVITKLQDIDLKNQHNLQFDDYMGITLSAADKDVSIVHIKGLLNYLMKLPSLFDTDNIILDDEKFNIRGSDWNNKCAMMASKEYCKNYAINHGVVFEEEEDPSPGE
ncbi:BMT4 [Candida pseudojiufengensis]|uniref:BMT4 n=1 Tax=Candida pseudojiufengensis TaxID=497109 RepID=UPI002224CBD0|nr:BMT4 [Candida pseudojiufengensis]KAI5960427.1 BMT4 [Candida pseudojiufengensis]